MNAINRMYGGNLGNPMRRTRPGGLWGVAGDDAGEDEQWEGVPTRRFIVHNMAPGSHIAIKRSRDTGWSDFTWAPESGAGWIDEAGHIWSTPIIPVTEPFDIRLSTSDGGTRDWLGISGALAAFPGANIHFDAAARTDSSPLMPWIFDPGVRRPINLVFAWTPEGTRVENLEANGTWADITGTRDESGGMVITGHSFGDPIRLRLIVGGIGVPLRPITPSTDEAFQRDPTRIVVPLSASSLPDSLRQHSRLDVSGLPPDATIIVDGFAFTRGLRGWSDDGTSFGMALMAPEGRITVEARSGDVCKRQAVDYTVARPASLSWGTMPTVRCPAPTGLLLGAVPTEIGGGGGGGGGGAGATVGNRIDIDHFPHNALVFVDGVDLSRAAGVRWIGTAYAVPVPSGSSVVQVEVRAPSGEVRASSSSVSATSASRLDWDTMRPTATADGNRVSIDHIIPGSRVIVGGADVSTAPGARWNGTAYVVPVAAGAALDVEVRAPSGEARRGTIATNPLAPSPLDWNTMTVSTPAPAAAPPPATSGILRIRRMPQGARVLVNDRDVTEATGAQWEGPEHLIYDVPTPIGSNTVTVVLANGERREVDFHNTPAAPDAEVRFDTMTIASPATSGPPTPQGGSIVVRNVPAEFSAADLSAWLPVEGAAPATFAADGPGRWKTAQIPAGRYHLRAGHGALGAAGELFAQTEVVNAHDSEVDFSAFVAVAPWNVATTPPPPLMLTPPEPMYPALPTGSAWSRLTPAEKVAVALLAAAVAGGGVYAYYQGKRA
jgi:hypothetical protein